MGSKAKFCWNYGENVVRSYVGMHIPSYWEHPIHRKYEANLRSTNFVTESEVKGIKNTKLLLLLRLLVPAWCMTTSKNVTCV